MGPPTPYWASPYILTVFVFAHLHVLRSKLLSWALPPTPSWASPGSWLAATISCSSSNRQFWIRLSTRFNLNLFYPPVLTPIFPQRCPPRPSYVFPFVPSIKTFRFDLLFIRSSVWHRIWKQIECPEDLDLTGPLAPVHQQTSQKIWLATKIKA